MEKLKKSPLKVILSYFFIVALIISSANNFQIFAADNSTLINQTVNAPQKGEYPISVNYTTHVQTYGWQKAAFDGETAGTTGHSKRMEALCIALNGKRYSGSIIYRSHVQSIGWQGWVKDGQISGTTGQAKRVEAVQIKLTGELANHYDVYYRTHIQNKGWTGWSKNGASSGSTGYAYRMEAIQIRVVAKNNAAPGSSQNNYFNNAQMVKYNTHVQAFGDMPFVLDGKGSGTTEIAKRMEALRVSLVSNEYPGDIEYSSHVQTYGWMNWVKNGQVSGTTGQGKRLEAVKIKLSGEISQYYDVYYRAYVQSYGWLSWVKNGEIAGTTGQAKRMEAIQIFLCQKGVAPSYPQPNMPKYEDPYKKSKHTVDPTKPMVALTYDDGPSVDSTNRILDALEKVNGRATFFVIGSRVSINRTAIKRAYDMGCSIGNHTWNHPVMSKLSAAEIKDEISSCDNAIQSVTGKRPTLIRPPYGDINSLVRETTDKPLILWSIDTLDWKTQNATSIYNSVIGHVRDGDIILMHDIYSSTATASERIIPELVRQGYQLVTVDELAQYRGYNIGAHNAYSRFYK